MTGSEVRSRHPGRRVGGATLGAGGLRRLGLMVPVVLAATALPASAAGSRAGTNFDNPPSASDGQCRPHRGDQPRGGIVPW